MPAFSASAVSSDARRGPPFKDLDQERHALALRFGFEALEELARRS